jgi:uncharacterized protein
MQRRPQQPHQEPSSQNIMAVILQSLPQEAGLTKIEYEGPRIALYSKNPGYLVRNVQLVSNMVNAIKRRIVIRTDESIRSSQDECNEMIAKTISPEAGLTRTFFDPVIGEVLSFVKRPWHVVQSEDFENLELIEKTGWRVRVKRSPSDLSVFESIYDMLNSSTSDRVRFYREVGDRIFRDRLTQNPEASIFALGGFAEIGRSCILVITGESKVLLDCGLNLFAHDSLSALPRFDITGVAMDEIDAVVLSHAHLDHCGFVPVLFKYGYRGPVYCTEPTLPAMYLLQSNYVAQSKSKALYSSRDIGEEVIRTITLNFGVVTDISPDVRLTLSNTGHMIGSSSAHLHIGNGDHNLVYTGDLKFGKTLALENASWNFSRLETLIIESTYGAKEDVFESRDRVDMAFADLINAVYRDGGSILVPAPVVGTSQEIILLLDLLMQSGKLPPQIRIIVDEAVKIGNSVYEAFPEYLDRELKERIMHSESTQFGFSENFVYSSEIVEIDKPSLIISAPSCLGGGNSAEYLRKIASDTQSMLLFLTYQPQGTVGRAILEGLKAPPIGTGGENIELACKVQKLNGLDNHSDYNQLLAFVSRLRPKLRRVLVNHGERSKAQNLASSISKILKVQTQHPLVQEAVKLL